jgi:hypothetical protein
MTAGGETLLDWSNLIERVQCHLLPYLTIVHSSSL